MATIDEDLGQLEKDIRQLKIEYEQYFGGGRSRPPADIEWRIETVIKRYGERGANMKYAQRYRYGNLAQAYARYREVFRKRLKQKEEGTVVRHFGAAAKAIEAARAAQTPVPEPPPASERRAAARGSLFTAETDRKDTSTQKLYEAFRSAKEKAGENISKLTPDAFEGFVRRKTEELRGKSGAGKVEFIVSVEDGKVKLKARTDGPAKSKH